MTAKSFSKEQILERIRFDNPWWELNEIDAYYKKLNRRAYFDLLKPLVSESEIKRAVILMGPRRVGKTVLLFHIIQDLIKDGINPRKIFYLSIETPIYNSIALETLFKYCMEAANGENGNGYYVFFDEIQYLKDWEVHLKSLVDSFNNTKFIVSGSAAAALKLKSFESGAGRFTDFLLPPLTFFEYLKLKGKEDFLLSRNDTGYVVPSNYDYSSLNENFIHYLNFGGYPEVIFSEKIQSDPGRYIRNDIIDKVLMRDLPSLYGIQDIQELNRLFNFIAYNTGNEMSLDEISKNSGVAKNTIKKYLTYLEAAFLIKTVNRIDFSAKAFKRANFFKVYLTNPSIRSALFAPLKDKDEFIGNMVETAIYSQYQHNTSVQLHYARWNKGEIDIVHLNNAQKPTRAVEIKWSDRFVTQLNELAHIKSFCDNHDLKEAWITTIDVSKSEVKNNFRYCFIPAAVYCLYAGQLIMEKKSGIINILS
ncbi:MAG: ATP-binding protein [bacterium]